MGIPAPGVGQTSTSALDISATEAAQRRARETDPYGLGDDTLSSAIERSGRAGGAAGGADPRLSALSQAATMSQWEQAPFTHGLYGFNRPSNWLDWRMRQQDEIGMQHFRNLEERSNILGRLWQENPYTSVINQSLQRLGDIPGQYDQIIGAQTGRLAQTGQNQLEQAMAQAGARGLKLSPAEIAMMQQNTAAGVAGQRGQMLSQKLQAEQAANAAIGEIAGRQAQVGLQRDQGIAQYGLGTLPEAVSFELMGATPEKVLNNKWRRQIVGNPFGNVLAARGDHGNIRERHARQGFVHNYFNNIPDWYNTTGPDTGVNRAIWELGGYNAGPGQIGAPNLMMNEGYPTLGGGDFWDKIINAGYI